MTRNEQIASIMLEAAELLKLDESAGANGAAKRFYENRINKDRAELKSLEKKRAAYKRAGYEDKIEDKAKYVRNKIDNSREQIEPFVTGSRETRKDMAEYSRAGHYTEDNELDRKPEYAGDTHKYMGKLETYGRAYNHPGYRGVKSNNNHRINKPLHNRINKRASLREAIDLFYDKAINADTIDEATEYINKAERLESLID